MPYFNFSGARLWYQDSGGAADTPAIVLLHAASGNCDSWYNQLPAFTAAGYRCIVYDRRGWGRSQSDASKVLTVDVCDDLHALVTHLGVEHFHLVSIAAGAIVALDYASTYPAQVISLVAACTLGGVKDKAYVNIQQRIWPAAMQALPAELREIGPTYRGFNPEGVRRWLEIEHNSRRPEAIDLHQPLRQAMDYARLATLRMPVLMIAGEADLLSPPALMQLLAKPIPDCQFTAVPGAGHAVFWEQPDVCNNLVLRFIGQHT